MIKISNVYTAMIVNKMRRACGKAVRYLGRPYIRKPLYHSYAVFGYKNRHICEAYVKNQQAKAPIITAYITYAIAKCRVRVEDQVSFAEFFCADAYYAMLARHLGATVTYGFDDDSHGFLSSAKRIRRKLGLTNVHLCKMNILDINNENMVDIVANIGGLYHVQNPVRALDISYGYCRKYLIIQSVVSLENESADYFEAPAPHWTWGCRFSRAWLDDCVAKKGYKVLDRHFNELEGNDRAVSRGSVYYLVEKT